MTRRPSLGVGAGEPLLDHDGSQAHGVGPRALRRPCADDTGLGGAHRPRRGRGPRIPSYILRAQAGFTLIELLVVIIVLGLLVGLVGPRLFGRVGQSKQAAARAQIELIGAGLDQYRLDIGAYPTTAQGLDALQRNPGVANWNEIGRASCRERV